MNKPIEKKLIMVSVPIVDRDVTWEQFIAGSKAWHWPATTYGEVAGPEIELIRRAVAAGRGPRLLVVCPSMREFCDGMKGLGIDRRRAIYCSSPAQAGCVAGFIAMRWGFSRWIGRDKNEAFAIIAERVRVGLGRWVGERPETDPWLAALRTAPTFFDREYLCPWRPSRSRPAEFRNEYLCEPWESKESKS